MLVFGFAVVTAQAQQEQVMAWNTFTNAIRYRIIVNGVTKFEPTCPPGSAAQITAHATALEGQITVMCSNALTGAFDIPAVPGSFNMTANPSGSGIGQAYTYEVWLRENPTNCVNPSFTMCITNYTSRPKRVFISDNGYEPPISGTFYVKPGASFCYPSTYNSCTQPGGPTNSYFYLYDDETDFNVGFDPLTGKPTYNPPTGIPYKPVGGSPTNNLSTGSITNTGSVPVPWQSLTNGIIDFAGTGSGAARDDTLKAGFNKLADQNIAIKNAIDLNTVALMEGFGAVTNALSGGGGGGTNDLSGLTNAIGAFHHDNTNLLAGIFGALGGTNGYGVSGYGTNSGSAYGLGEGLTTGISGSADAVMGDFGETAPEILAGGSAADLSFQMAGHTINLDPEVRFPGVGTFFKAGLMLAFGMWLGRYLVDLYLKVATVYATSQTGGVPAVGPFGSIGLGIAGLVAVAVVTLWLAVFALLFEKGLNYVGTIAATANGVTTGNATALYLINYFFPVAFIMSALWTRIIAPFAVTKLVIITTSAQRFLLGK